MPCHEEERRYFIISLSAFGHEKISGQIPKVQGSRANIQGALTSECRACLWLDLEYVK